MCINDCPDDNCARCKILQQYEKVLDASSGLINAQSAIINDQVKFIDILLKAQGMKTLEELKNEPDKNQKNNLVDG